MSLNGFHDLFIISLGLWCVSAVRSDTCNSTTEGSLSCISFGSRYHGSQWAVCAREQEVRRNREQRCYGSYCWLPCMKVTRGRNRGFISMECSCGSSNTLAGGNLDTTCYTLIEGECSWYSNCLAKSAQCSGAHQLAQRICSVFERHSDALSVDGKLYIRDLQLCLQRSLYSLILPGSTQVCSLRMQQARDATTYCLKKTSISPTFCHLVPNDQSNIFWTLKSILVDAFDPTSRDILEGFRNCYTGNVQSAEERFVITADAVETAHGHSFVDNFAQVLGWSSGDIVWDGHLMPQLDSTSITSFDVLFKPKSEFDLTKDDHHVQKSAIDIDPYIHRIEVEIQRNSLIATSVIYPKTHSAYIKDIGRCPFRFGNGGMFDEYLPEHKKIRDVRFDLYRRHGTGTGREMLNYFDDESIQSSSYNGNLKTYFITHGFTSDGNETWIQQMVSAFLRQDDCNVIVVDWKRAADISIKGIYIQAAVNTRLIGCLLGKMVEKLTNLTSTDFKDVHLVGHSLGAHLSGFAGAYNGGNIGRITGLDPAGPGFTKLGRHFRLDETDASFVDIIHSDTVLFGINRPIGRIDFYPNGGHNQPGCHVLGCSHRRACDLFTESINPTHKCLACNCSKSGYDEGRCTQNGICAETAVMGFEVDTTSSGSFYLSTNGTSPFCTGSLPDRKRKKRMAENNIMMGIHKREQVNLRKKASSR